MRMLGSAYSYFANGDIAGVNRRGPGPQQEIVG